MLTVFVVSDATGDTAQRMMRAATGAVSGRPGSLAPACPRAQAAASSPVVHEARDKPAIIIHTLVSDELRRVMRAESRLHGVDALDIMGPILERLSVHLKVAPQEKPGLFQDLTEAKTREIEAVSFAFRHDDGQNPQDLDRAEVVLVGVSRAMKTPTMLYMAYRGWFAANVPLVPGLSPPKALLDVPSDRVFCLMMAPEASAASPRPRRGGVNSAAALCVARTDRRGTVLRRGTLPQAPLATRSTPRANRSKRSPAKSSNGWKSRADWKRPSDFGWNPHGLAGCVIDECPMRLGLGQQLAVGSAQDAVDPL